MTGLSIGSAAGEKAGNPEIRAYEPQCHPTSGIEARARTASFVFLVLLVIVVLPISRLIPPFQSPDEFNHVKRAYLLSHGHVFLGAEEGRTGGNIDGGLLDYIALYHALPFNYHEKVTDELTRRAGSASWSHQARFSPLPNTAVYFPLSYLPQAAALFISERTGLGINDTYYLARAFSLIAAAVLLWVAMRLYPVPLPVYGLFALPMVVFQLGSASLDGVSFAMCVLVCSLYMRAATGRFEFGRGMHAALIVCLFLLITARTNLIGIVWLPLMLYWLRRKPQYLVTSGILIASCIAWVAFAAVTVKGEVIQIQSISPISILLYYLKHLGELFVVMYSTVTNGTLLLSYWRMFVGVLGWIDTPLDWAIYWTFAIALAALGILCVQTNRRLLLSRAHLSLLVGAVLSTALLFVIFLATFSLHPATFIGAIQGRYFYPMAIFVAFALFDAPTSRRRVNAARAIVFLMLALSAVSMAPKLIDRYWAG